MIVAFVGDNAPAREKAAKEYIAGFVNVHGSAAIDRFIGEDLDQATFNSAISTVPFLSPKRMVVVRGLSANKQLTENFESLSEKVADTTDLVIIEDHLDSRSRFLKTLNQVADIRQFSNLEGDDLIDWVIKYTKSLGGEITQSSARALIDRVGTNHQLLANELEKLVLYSPKITVEAIKELTVYSPKSSVFAMLDAALTGDISTSLKLYGEQRAQGMEPQAILGMITWQLHTLALVKSAGNLSAKDIVSATKLNPFVVRKNQAKLNKMPQSKLIKLFEQAIEVDGKIKSLSIDPDTAVQTLIMSF
jgi:DNA polymerase-3 subunit delta